MLDARAFRRAAGGSELVETSCEPVLFLALQCLRALLAQALLANTAVLHVVPVLFIAADGGYIA